jgi:hypothetical protein
VDRDGSLAMGCRELAAATDERVLLLGGERIAAAHAVLERRHDLAALVAPNRRARITVRHRRGRVSHASSSLLISVGGL